LISVSETRSPTWRVADRDGRAGQEALPLIVTAVPPAAGPEVGLMDVTFGAAKYV